MTHTTFDFDKVITALNRKALPLWIKISDVSRAKFDQARLEEKIADHDENLADDLSEAEAAIANGDANWEDYLNGEACSLKGGSQGYATQVAVNYWS